MPRCDACALDLSPLVYSRHIDRDHRLDLCIVCSKPVLKYAMTPTGHSLSSCSSSCVEEFRRRGTYFSCLKRPVAGADISYCAACRTSYRIGLVQAGRVTQQIRAIERAERLPEVYQRSGPSLWDGTSEEGS